MVVKFPNDTRSSSGLGLLDAGSASSSAGRFSALLSGSVTKIKQFISFNYSYL